MIHFDQSLTLDSTTLWIIGAAVILVFSLHFYLQRLMSKPSHSVPVPVKNSSEPRSAKSVANEQHANK